MYLGPKDQNRKNGSNIVTNLINTYKIVHIKKRKILKSQNDSSTPTNHSCGAGRKTGSHSLGILLGLMETKSEGIEQTPQLAST